MRITVGAGAMLSDPDGSEYTRAVACGAQRYYSKRSNDQLLDAALREARAILERHEPITGTQAYVYLGYGPGSSSDVEPWQSACRDAISAWIDTPEAE